MVGVTVQAEKLERSFEAGVPYPTKQWIHR